jgi:hypothetical protein
MANSRNPWGRRPDRPKGYHGHLPGPEPPCPNCGKGLGGFTAVKLDGAEMGIGDVSICCGCEVLVRYVGEPIGFVRLEGEELILARAHPDMRRAQRVVREVKMELEQKRRSLSGNVVAFPNRHQRRAAERRARGA